MTHPGTVTGAAGIDEPYQSWAGFLHDQLAAAMSSWHPDKLAYLTATSKPERPIRDRLAWTLQQHLQPEMNVACEWKRRDLTIHTTDGQPQVGVEVKVAAAFNLCSAKTPGWHPLLSHLGNDLDKLHDIAPAAERYGLMVFIHIGQHIPKKIHHLVKYAKNFNSTASKNDDGADGVLALSRERAKLSLLHLGQPIRPHEDLITVTGEAFGLTVTVDCYLIDVPATPLPTRTRGLGSSAAGTNSATSGAS